MNYFFKTTFRSLLRNKGYSYLNIFGLAISITCAVLIFLWVEDEVNFDEYNVKKEFLYQVYQNQPSEGKIQTINATPGPLAQGIKEEIPGIKNSCRTTWSRTLSFSIGEKRIDQDGLYADASIFSMFTFPFIQGHSNSAFKEAYSLVITERMAHRFFGNDNNVVGKILKADTNNFVISGVIKDLPENSTLHFDWLAPFQIHYNRNQWLDHWEYNGAQTFVELNPNANPAAIDKKLSGYTQLKSKKRIAKPFLLSMKDWRPEK